MLAGEYLDVIAVYCARAWRISTWRATGVWPMTSPPLTMDSVPLDRLKADVVYLRLHGMPGQPYLYGDPGFPTALAAEGVAAADFRGSIVFMEGCYGADIPGIRDVVDAFLEAGALAIVGSQKSTWGYKYKLGPSSLVGREFLKRLFGGSTVEMALAYGRAKVPSPYAEGWALAGDGTIRLGV